MASLIELLKTRLTQEFPLDHILDRTELEVPYYF